MNSHDFLDEIEGSGDDNYENFDDEEEYNDEYEENEDENEELEELPKPLPSTLAEFLESPQRPTQIKKVELPPKPIEEVYQEEILSSKFAEQVVMSINPFDHSLSLSASIRISEQNQQIGIKLSYNNKKWELLELEWDDQSYKSGITRLLSSLPNSNSPVQTLKVVESWLQSVLSHKIHEEKIMNLQKNNEKALEKQRKEKRALEKELQLKKQKEEEERKKRLEEREEELTARLEQIRLENPYLKGVNLSLEEIADWDPDFIDPNESRIKPKQMVDHIVSKPSKKMKSLYDLSLQTIISNLLLYDHEFGKYVPVEIKSKIFHQLIQSGKLTHRHLVLLLDTRQKTLNFSLGSYFISTQHLLPVGIICGSLQTLNLKNCTLVNDKALVRISEGCHFLKTLDLTNCTNISSSGLLSVANGCPHLQWLSLENVNVDDLSLQRFMSRSVDLQYLNVSNCPLLSAGTIILALGMCIQLRTLDARCKKKKFFTETDYGTITKPIPYIQLVNISGMNIYSQLPISSKVRFDSVTELCLRGYTSTPLEIFKSILKRFPNIISVDLSECGSGVNVDLIRSMCQTHPQIQILNLSSSKHLATKVIKDFMDIAKNLTYLNLNDCENISAISILKRARFHPSLQTLLLSRTSSIRTPIIPPLSEPSPSKLSKLDLSYTTSWMIDYYVFSLINSFSFPCLKSLSLRGSTTLTQKALLHILDLPSLVELDLSQWSHSISIQNLFLICEKGLPSLKRVTFSTCFSSLILNQLPTFQNPYIESINFSTHTISILSTDEFFIRYLIQMFPKLKTLDISGYQSSIKIIEEIFKNTNKSQINGSPLHPLKKVTLSRLYSDFDIVSNSLRSKYQSDVTFIIKSFEGNLVPKPNDSDDDDDDTDFFLGNLFDF